MKPCPRRKMVKWLFVLYCLMMLWLLLFRRIGSDLGAGRYNLQPMDTVQRYLWVLRHSTDLTLRRHAAANLFGNVMLFVPFGACLPILFPKLQKFGWFLLWGFFVITSMELLQTITGLGALDVDDFILNLVGTMLGFLSWKLWHRAKVQKQ